MQKIAIALESKVRVSFMEDMKLVPAADVARMHGYNPEECYLIDADKQGMLEMLPKSLPVLRADYARHKKLMQKDARKNKAGN